MLKKDIIKAIDQNIAAEVGNHLKTRLEKAETDAQLVKDQAAQIKNLDKEIKEKDKTILELRSKLDKHAGLGVREATIRTTEQKLKEMELEAKLGAEMEKTQFMKDVTLGLVKNTNFKRSVFGGYNDNFPMKDQSGYITTQYKSGSSNFDETITEE
jgi:hypothetical protein